MIAAAAASRRAFRSRQSEERDARRLSASTLVSRSSCTVTGSALRARSRSANTAIRGVIAFADPSSRRGIPTTIDATPSSSAASRATSASATPRASPFSPVVRSVVTGRASVPVASLIATPMRRSPTSSPTIRATPYNSRTPWAMTHDRDTARRAPTDRMGRFFCVTAVSCAVAATLIAQSPDSASRGTSSRLVEERIRALQRESEQLAGQTRTLVGELRKLEIERDLRIEQAKQAETAAEAARQTLERATKRLAEIEQQRIAQLPDLKVQLVDVYKRGRSGYARMIFGAQGLREFARATRAVSALATINERRVVEHRRTL